jgi:hypothetical protein
MMILILYYLFHLMLIVENVVDKEFHFVDEDNIHRLMLVNDHIDHNENNRYEIVDRMLYE